MLTEFKRKNIGLTLDPRVLNPQFSEWYDFVLLSFVIMNRNVDLSQTVPRSVMPFR